MKGIYKPLFTPWKIRNLEIKNRIVLTSMGGTSIFGWMEPCHFDKEAANFLLEKAKNNVGLVLPGIAPIQDPILNRYLYKNKRMFKKLKVFMEEFHKTGAKMFVQLTAGFGRSMAVNAVMEKIANNKILNVLAKPILNVDRLCKAPSATPNRWSDKVPSKEMSVKEIKKMIDAFAKTAKLCKEAGVDGVEIHAVHEGYLLDQFTLPYCNMRTDDYGGNFENRYRFPVEIVKAIKAVCGDDYPVSLRYSVVSKTKGFRSGAMPGEDYHEVGRDMIESEKAAKYLQDAGYDMLNSDNGTYDAWYWAHPPMYMPQNCNLDDVAHIKKYVTIPVVCAGRMEPDVAAKAIAAGKIDAMGVARQFLADPQWVTKLMNDQMDDIRPCICCHNGCFNMCHYEGVANDQDLSDTMHMARCAINPITMQTKKYKIKPAKVTKNVTVIGGGVGGMEVALVSAMRGHNVTVYEKSNQLGGVFIAASNFDFKEKDQALLDWYRRQIAKYSNIKVILNKEINNINEIKADEIVIATGAKANHLTIPGDATPIEASSYLMDKRKVKGKVLIIGGGLTGCEIAYDLYLKKQHPIIVEMKQDLIAVKGVCLANSSYLRDFFKLHKVPVYLNSKVLQVKDGVATIATKNGNVEVEVDSVITSVGYKPNPLAKKDVNVHIVGDAHHVGNLRTVIWRAWDVAMKL